MKNTVQKLCICFVAVCLGSHSIAQNNHFDQIDLTLGVNSSHTNLSLSYQYIGGRKVGENRKNRPIMMEYGIGARLAAFSGNNLYFPTVPEYFGGWIPEKDPDQTHYDSVFVASPQIFAVNILANITFCIKDRLRIGATADIIGYSFGGTRNGQYINGSETRNVIVSPAYFNNPLYSDGRLGGGTGCVNIEYFASYTIGDHWSFKVGLQMIAMEYITDTEVQQFPKPNDRFRNESILFSVGTSFKID